jgi:hypothetical protein
MNNPEAKLPIAQQQEILNEVFAILIARGRRLRQQGWQPLPPTGKPTEDNSAGA